MILGKSIFYTYQCEHTFTTDGGAKEWKHRDRCPTCRAWKKERYKWCLWCHEIFALQGRPSSTKYCPTKGCYDKAHSAEGRGTKVAIPDPVADIINCMYDECGFPLDGVGIF